jgi:hypothetical protein
LFAYFGIHYQLDVDIWIFIFDFWYFWLQFWPHFQKIGQFFKSPRHSDLSLVLIKMWRGLYNKTLLICNLQKIDKFSINLVSLNLQVTNTQQGILKGKVSLYHWPPVWLVWNQLYDNWQFLFYLQNRLIRTSQTGGQQYSDTSPFSIPWH